MLRDLLTQKCAINKRLLILDTPEHVESENIKFKIGHRSSAYQFFFKHDFYFIKCGKNILKYLFLNVIFL
jgi:hypothetical protein